MTMLARALVVPTEDHCLGFFREMYEAGRVPIPQHARVLEIGSAEADWLTPFKDSRPDVHLTGMDQRSPGEKGANGDYGRPGADVFVLGDLLNADLFAPASFDVIVAISVIEHVGIGRYGDPLDPDGDMKAMAHCHRWVKPNGLMYIDVPYRPQGPSDPFRKYNETDLRARVIHGWREIDRQHFDANHPDAPYVALVLKP